MKRKTSKTRSLSYESALRNLIITSRSGSKTRAFFLKKRKALDKIYHYIIIKKRIKRRQERDEPSPNHDTPYRKARGSGGVQKQRQFEIQIGASRRASFIRFSTSVTGIPVLK